MEVLSVRLSQKDQDLVRLIQEHFANLEPLPIEIGKSEVMRLGLRVIARLVRDAPSELRDEHTLAQGRLDEEPRDTLRHSILGAVEANLRQLGHPSPTAPRTSTRALLAALREQGINVPGGNPEANLRSRLYHSNGRIRSRGFRRGWTLPPESGDQENERQHRNK